MKIAMIGSGAAGSVFAAYLRKGGAELWLVDKYKAHMDKIAADGLIFRTPEGEEVLTGFHTSATAHDIGTMDMVILMVKATQTADVMADTMPASDRRRRSCRCKTVLAMTRCSRSSWTPTASSTAAA